MTGFVIQKIPAVLYDTHRMALVAASVGALAGVVGVEVGELTERLAADGFVVDDAGLTIAEVAESNGVDADDLLFVAFRD